MCCNLPQFTSGNIKHSSMPCPAESQGTSAGDPCDAAAPAASSVTAKSIHGQLAYTSPPLPQQVILLWSSLPAPLPPSPEVFTVGSKQ